MQTVSARGLRIAKGRIEAKMDRLLEDPDMHDESLRFAMHLLRYRDGLFLFSIERTSTLRTTAPNRPCAPR
jgi:hypothetical protein